MRRTLIAAAALVGLTGCGGPAPAPSTPPAAPPNVTTTDAVEPLTLAEIDAAGLLAAGFQANPDSGSTSVGLWQTADCTVQVLVENVRVSGDDRTDSESAFAQLPDSYSHFAAHPDVEIPLAQAGSIEAPVMTAHITHADGQVTPATVAMRVIGARESLVSITEWCWDHAVSEEEFAAAVAGLSLDGVSAP